METINSLILSIFNTLECVFVTSGYVLLRYKHFHSIKLICVGNMKKYITRVVSSVSAYLK